MDWFFPSGPPYSGTAETRGFEAKKQILLTTIIDCVILFVWRVMFSIRNLLNSCRNGYIEPSSHVSKADGD